MSDDDREAGLGRWYRVQKRGTEIRRVRARQMRVKRRGRKLFFGRRRESRFKVDKMGCQDRCLGWALDGEVLDDFLSGIGSLGQLPKLLLSDR